MDEKKLVELLLQKCYRFLSLRNRTEKEMKDYLNKKIEKFKLDNPDKFIDLIVQQLKEEDLIDDKKFIAWWVEQRSYFKPKGHFVLKQELLQKGINHELIDQYFEENKIDELTLAKTILQKKVKVLKGLKKEERYQKAISFLVRRGFSFEIANKVFRFIF
jgi:regulatory protein